MRSVLIPLLLLLCAFFVGGCVSIDVQNVADVEVRVLIRTPDSGRGYTRLVESGQVASTFSTQGGSFTISTLPNEEYRQLVLDVREQLATRLYEERATLSPSDVAEIVQRITQLTENLELLGQEQASCSGSVTDFGSVTAIITWDDVAQKWSVVCSVRNEEILGD